ncbi:MAG: ABC transporter substrate-binding protein [Actinomycetota bacterium]
MKRSSMALLCVIALVATACGQKPRVHVPSGPARFAASEATGATGDTGPLDENGDLTSGDASTLAGAEGGSQGAGATTTTTRKGGGPVANAGGITPDKNDRAGVTADTIKIGFHAPLTGAAAVDLADLEHGNRVFSEWLKMEYGVTIFGRKTVILFENDEYKPSTAVNVCRKLVEEEGVFMLIGGAGTDQIQACARYAFGKKVPYISAGVTEKVVSKLPNYFAFSASYPDQGPPLAKLIKTFDASAYGGGGGKVLIDRCNPSACAPDPGAPSAATSEPPKVAIVYSDTEGFHDARDDFVRAYGSGVLAIPITKFNINGSDANGVVQRLKQEGIDVVYILTSPTNFGNILNPAAVQRYFPRWVGIGLTMGINLFAATSCGKPGFEHAIFLNPWFSVRHPLSDQWKAAWKKYGGPDQDARDKPEDHDIAFGLWGGSIIQHILLKAAGKDLTRSGFIAAAHKLQAAVAPDDTKAGDIIDVYYPLTSKVGDNFGSAHSNILWADCGPSRRTGNYNYFNGPNAKPLTTADL